MLKTFRDIRETIGSFISIVVVIMIGCFFLAGITAGSRAVTAQVKDYYESTNYASYRAEYLLINSAAVDEIASEKKVTRAAGYNSFYSSTHVGGSPYDIYLATLTPGIDDPKITSGRLPEQGADELIIDDVFAKAHSVRLNDKLSFDIDTIDVITVDQTGAQPYSIDRTAIAYEFTVVGFYHSPDSINKVDMHNTAARPDEFIAALIPGDRIALHTPDASVRIAQNGFILPMLKLADAGVELFNNVRIRTSGSIDYEAVLGRRSLASQSDFTDMLSDTTKPAGLMLYALDRKSFPSVQAFNAVNDTIAALAAVLPFIFFAVAAAITVISMSKTVDNQRMQIGIIQGLGVSKSGVYFSYIFYALFACLLGGTAGGLIGLFTVPMLIDVLYARTFSMPPTPKHVSVLFLFLAIIAASALACLAAFISCHRTLKVKPAQAMRPKPPKKSKRILAERWKWLWSRLGFGAKMNMRNMFLHKIRLLLSSVGIIGCLALLIALVGMKDNMQIAFDRYHDAAGYDVTAVTKAAVDTDSFDFDNVSDYFGSDKLRAVTFAPTLSARFAHAGKTADMTVIALPTAADANNYSYADADCVRLFTDKSGKARVKLKDDTFAIPKDLADKLGVKAGDTVSVTGALPDNRGSVQMNIKVTHVIYQYFDLRAYCSYAVLKNAGAKLYATTAYVSFGKGVNAIKAAENMNKLPVLRDARPFKETYDTLTQKMVLLDYAVVLFALGAAILAMAVIYNITATNLKERTREIATLMVLGYKPHETASMLIVENMVITAIGCIIGLPLGYGLMMWLINLASSFNVHIASFFNWYVALGCIALTFAFSLLATLLFNLKIKKISMVESLKSVE